MSWWSEQVVPRMTDVLLRSDEVGELRARVCEGLSGEVVEVGFGSGLNVRHYPDGVRTVLAVEPSDVAWHIAREKHLQAEAPAVRRAGLDGQQLDLPDASVDAALSTFSLCTIPDAAAAVAEVHRVLRPGGRFAFLEHGLSPEPRVARWQRRLTPVQRRLAAGCHLDRPIADLVAGAGFVLDDVETFYFGAPAPAAKVLGHVYLGHGVKR